MVAPSLEPYIWYNNVLGLRSAGRSAQCFGGYGSKFEFQSFGIRIYGLSVKGWGFGLEDLYIGLSLAVKSSDECALGFESYIKTTGP